MDVIRKYHKILFISTAPHVMNAVKASIRERPIVPQEDEDVVSAPVGDRVENMFKKEGSTNADGSSTSEEYEMIGAARPRSTYGAHSAMYGALCAHVIVI